MTASLVKKHPRSIAQLVTTTWGWSLAALFLLVILALGVYWNHPFYDSPSREMSPLEEFLPLIVAGILWMVCVVVIILRAVAYGRRNNLRARDLSHVRAANWFLFVLATVNTIGFRDAIGAGIATFVNGCLLILCVIYLAVARDVRAEVRWDAYLTTLGIVAAIVLCWV